MTSEPCRVSEEEVLAYVCGDLGGDEETALAEHLGECAGCRDQAAEFTALGETLGDCRRDETVRWHGFETPFGTTYLAATENGLACVTWRAGGEDDFVDRLAERFPDRLGICDPDALAAAERQLHEYFSGERTAFDVPVDLSRLSGFDQAVLEAIREIPFGDVIPYAEVARRIGRPRAARAVGGALGRNPVTIVVPCHRVVRSDGSLGGYGAGVRYKERLLALEGRPDLSLAS